MSDEFNIEGYEESPITEQEQQGGLGTMDVYADIVYCLDVTQSMRPIIEKVKETALNLHNLLQEKMISRYQRNIRQLRIKVIAFRDIYADGDYAFEISPFFWLPDEADKFADFVNGLEAKGGGDIPENGLEALAMAMQTDWCTTIDESIRKRHVVVMFTDASAHPLEKSANYSGKNYPENMPKTYADLIDMWYGQGSCVSGGAAITIDPIAARLAIFAPEGSEPWVNIAEDFNNAFFQPIERGNGGRDISTDEIVKMIGETMAG